MVFFCMVCLTDLLTYLHQRCLHFKHGCNFPLSRLSRVILVVLGSIDKQTSYALDDVQVNIFQKIPFCIFIKEFEHNSTKWHYWCVEKSAQVFWYKCEQKGPFWKWLTCVTTWIYFCVIKNDMIFSDIFVNLSIILFYMNNNDLTLVKFHGLEKLKHISVSKQF